MVNNIGMYTKFTGLIKTNQKHKSRNISSKILVLTIFNFLYEFSRKSGLKQ